MRGILVVRDPSASCTHDLRPNFWAKVMCAPLRDDACAGSVPKTIVPFKLILTVSNENPIVLEKKLFHNYQHIITDYFDVIFMCNMRQKFRSNRVGLVCAFMVFCEIGRLQMATVDGHGIIDGRVDQLCFPWSCFGHVQTHC